MPKKEKGEEEWELGGQEGGLEGRRGCKRQGEEIREKMNIRVFDGKPSESPFSSPPPHPKPIYLFKKHKASLLKQLSGGVSP